MNYLFLGSTRRKLAVIALIAGAVAVGACSTSTTSSMSPPSGHAAIKPSTYSWASWITVTPVPEVPTEVTGINNLMGSNGPEIVGFYTENATTAKAQSYSFTSQGTAYSTYVTASYPLVDNGTQPSPSAGTQMNAIATQASQKDLPVLAGWVSEPGDQAGTWPVVDNQGLWSLESNGTGFGAGMKHGAIAKLFGINDNDIAVGYTAALSAPTATKASYFLTGGTPTALSLNQLGTVSASVAYGIDDAGDMVGTASLNSGKYASESWYALCTGSCPAGSTFGGGSYCYAPLENPPYTAQTTAYAISATSAILGGSKTRLIAGSYTDSSGVTHGFLVQVTTTLTGACQTGTFQTIDEPNTKTLTVVRDVNSDGYIVGYYKDTSNKHYQDGFVGIPATSADRKRLRNHI